MKFTPLPLDSVWEITLDRREDDRGYFARTFCADEFAAKGLNTSWVQMNISLSTATGTLRGMHFQRDVAAEIKLVRCLRGRAHDVIVDLRAGSDTYGQSCAVTLDAESHNAIYIPKGFAHGFQTLAPDTALQYAHSVAYAPGYEGGVNALDAALTITWPLPPVQMSQRDVALPLLSDVDPIRLDPESPAKGV